MYTLEFLVQPRSGIDLFGYVVVGICEDQSLKLRAEFPDRQWSGQDPRFDQAIKDGITEDEKRRISDEPELPPWIEIQLNFRIGHFII